MLWLVKLGDATGTITICNSCEVALWAHGPHWTSHPCPQALLLCETRCWLQPEGEAKGVFLKCEIAHQKRDDSSAQQIYEVKAWLRRNTRQEPQWDSHPHHLPCLSCGHFFHQWRANLVLCCHPCWAPPRIYHDSTSTWPKSSRPLIRDLSFKAWALNTFHTGLLI